jgi:hypothetical protein
MELRQRSRMILSNRRLTRSRDMRYLRSYGEFCDSMLTLRLQDFTTIGKGSQTRSLKSYLFIQTRLGTRCGTSASEEKG